MSTCCASSLPEVQSSIHYLSASDMASTQALSLGWDWLWASSTDKVYGFDTEVTLVICLIHLNEEQYMLVAL